MTTPRMQYDPKVTRNIVSSGMIADSPFLLLDVGASGGIGSYWHCFGPFLIAIGFDPLKVECERLNRESDSDRIRYIDAFIGDGSGTSHPDEYPTELMPIGLPRIFERTSPLLALDLLGQSPTQRFNNDDPNIVFSDRNFSLDSFLSAEGIGSVDFIKVDTDGHDYAVLKGARESLVKRQVLGVFVECQFHGVMQDDANLYANIDRLLRQCGFSLFDIEVYRCTRATLPGHFVYDLAAQTHEGQVIWGDALYLRDYAAGGYSEKWGITLNRAKLLKLLALYEIFGLYDCAAELIVHFGYRELAKIPSKAWLDLLAKEMEPSAVSYHTYYSKFSQDPKNFFPSSQGSTAATSEVNTPLFLRFLRGLKKLWQYKKGQ